MKFDQLIIIQGEETYEGNETLQVLIPNALSRPLLKSVPKSPGLGTIMSFGERGPAQDSNGSSLGGLFWVVTE